MNLHTAIEKELSRAYIAGMIGANLFEDEAIKRIINHIEKHTLKITKNSKLARKFLISTGIYTKTGKLSKNYK